MPTSRAEVEAELSRDVLPKFRTRAELYRWGAVRAYAADAAEGVAALQDAAANVGAGPVIPYVQLAIGSTVRVILRADDSSGLSATSSGSCWVCTPSSARPTRRRRPSWSAG